MQANFGTGSMKYKPFYVFSVLFLLCLCAHQFICALWSPAGKGLPSWLSFVVSNCEFVTFPLVSWVKYLIVSIPDLCTLTYFYDLRAGLRNPPSVLRPGLDVNLATSTIFTANCFPVSLWRHLLTRLNGPLKKTEISS